MERQAESFSIRTVRALFAPRDDPYAGVDVTESRRIGGVICISLALVLVPLTLASAPTEAIGDAGWFAVAGIAAIDLLVAFALLRPGSRIGFGGLLALTYCAVAQVAALEWLAGSANTPYHLLYLAPGVLPPSIHPPRRALPLLATITAALFLPLLYEGWHGGAAAEMGLEAGFIWMLALITMAVTNAVREQRLLLISEGEAANRLARRDGLTGLGNRRAFDEVLEREIARSRRSAAPISIVVIDLDRFKSVNDRFGHLVGDQALKTVSEALHSTVRVPDTAFRWGGDEFALILPDSPLEGAVEVGERLRRVLQESSALPNGDPIEISVGIAELKRDQSADALLEEADADLFAEKGEHGIERTAPAPSA